MVNPKGPQEVLTSKSISRRQHRCVPTKINLLTPPSPMQVQGYLHLPPHSSCVNMLKLLAAMKHCPRTDIPATAPSRASSRPFSWAHRPLILPYPCCSFGLQRASVIAACFRWWLGSAELPLSKDTRRVIIFTMPHQATSLQPSLKNTPSLSYVAQSEVGPRQPEAGDSSESDEKGRESGTNTPSALLPPKDEATSDTSHPAPSAEFVVWWNEPADQDPENPMNWSSKKKWFNIITISVISFLV